MSKGTVKRPANEKKLEENWERIFGPKKKSNADVAQSGEQLPCKQ